MKGLDSSAFYSARVQGYVRIYEAFLTQNTWKKRFAMQQELFYKSYIYVFTNYSRIETT